MAGRLPWASALSTSRRVLPGVALCGAVAMAGYALAAVEFRLFGRAWLEPLVLAILIGAAVRTAWTPDKYWTDGIGFCAKTLLEIAVVLLGAAISARTVADAGAGLLFGIAAVVGCSIPASFWIGRICGLPWRMAVLVACGNSICGNSAIAAVAPVIGANGRDVAASIAFTAVFGVAVVLVLPLLAPALHLSDLQYGAFAGLTVYAVPQVLAATAPVGALAVQMGTLVKLVRVLLLGPVVVGLSLIEARRHRQAANAPAREASGKRPPLRRLVPWFIIGFMGMAALRSLGLIPAFMLGPIASVATLLTVLSMAALGLGVDVRTVGRAGAGVATTVTASLLVLAVISLGLIRLLGIA